MRLSDIPVFSFEALKERKLRSVLTIFMVAIGIALITALNGLSGGINGFITNQFNTLAPNVLTITPASQFGGFGGPGQGAPGGAGGGDESIRVTLTPLVVRNLGSINGVEHIIPSYRASIRLISAGKVQSTQMIGIDTYKLPLIIPTLELERGRLVDSNDITGVGLGYRVAHPPGEERPFAEVGSLVRVERNRFDDKLQRTVTDSKSFIVRGILKETGNPQYDNAIAVTLPTADSFLKKSSKFDSIFLVTGDADLNTSVEQEIKNLYGGNIGVSSPKAILQTVNNLIGGFTLFLSAIGGVSILVGGVGIVTTLFTAVMERTREIGTLKALGATSRDILTIFISESFIIGLLGSIIGILLGAGLSILLIPILGGFGGGGNLPSISPAFAPETVSIILTVGVMISTIAGIYPAWRASKMRPVEALRKE